MTFKKVCQIEKSSETRCWVEEEALSYVAGYVAFRVRNLDPSLGKMSREYSEDVDKSGNSWIHSLSNGKLTVPSDEWKNTVNYFEVEFKSIHGGGGYFSK